MRFNVAELIKRAGRTRQKELVLTAISPPAGLEADLRKLYLSVVAEWARQATATIMPAYTATLAEGMHDAPADVQGDIEDASGALNRLVLSIGPDLEAWVVRVEQWHRGRMGTQFSPTGVKLDTLLGQGDVTKTLQSTLAENTALIRSLNEQMRNGISGAVFRGLTNRTPAAEVSREISKLTGVGKSRANLIAADQLQKLTGRLDQERQEQIGIVEFVWQHSHKKNPRPYHAARDGMKFRWDSYVAQTDPPGRAIRCGCKARPVVDLEGDVPGAPPIDQPVPEAVPEPAPEPPPPPPKPDPRKFQPVANPDITAETIKVETRLALQKVMRDEFEQAARDEAYTSKMNDSWGGRSVSDRGNAVFSAAFDDEAVSMVRALKPELDSLADQIGVPRLRGFKSISGTKHVANQGDGIMALNPTYFNGYASRIGGRAPNAAGDAIRAQREAIKAEMAPLVEQLKAARETLDGFKMADEGWLPAYNEYDALRKRYVKLREADDKLWRRLGPVDRAAKGGEVSKWKPGDPAGDRPFTIDKYWGDGIDKARTTLYHEFGHHVHQYLGRTGARRVVGAPPLELELRRLYREARADGRMDLQASKYSTTNEHEWFAENFSAFVLGRRDLVDKVLLKLIERIFAGGY